MCLTLHEGRLVVFIDSTGAGASSVSMIERSRILSLKPSKIREKLTHSEGGGDVAIDDCGGAKRRGITLAGSHLISQRGLA